MCIRDRYTTWLSHSKAKLNAVAMKPSKHILHISKTHNALVFENSLYKVDGAVISLLPYTSKRNYTCACITFQVEGENDQFLFADGRIGQPHLEVFLHQAKKFVSGV